MVFIGHNGSVDYAGGGRVGSVRDTTRAVGLGWPKDMTRKKPIWPYRLTTKSFCYALCGCRIRARPKADNARSSAKFVARSQPFDNN